MTIPPTSPTHRHARNVFISFSSQLYCGMAFYGSLGVYLFRLYCSHVVIVQYHGVGCIVAFKLFR